MPGLGLNLFRTPVRGGGKGMEGKSRFSNGKNKGNSLR